MSNLNKLRYYENLLSRNNYPYHTKAAFLGYVLNTVNKNLLQTNSEYKSVYNNIVKKFNTPQNKIRMLLSAKNANISIKNVKWVLRSADMNLIRRSNQYAKLYNEVANKYDLPSSQIIGVRPQQGPTCWFNSIINGLLLSERPRNLMRKMVALVPKVTYSGEVCPMKTAGREWFMRYIKNRLDGNLSNTFKNANVINAIGLRGLTGKGKERSFISFAGTLTKGQTGGTIDDLIWFYNKLFPYNFTNKSGLTTPLFVMKKFGTFFSQANPEVPHTMQRNGVEYELTHGWISFKVNILMGHIIAGYKTRTGKYKAFDSNVAKDVPDYDWTKSAKQTLATALYKPHYKTSGTVIYGIYMRK